MNTDKRTGLRLVHYKVQFKSDNESWIHQEAYPQQDCHFLNTADAEKVIKQLFQNKSITEATVIKVSEEIEYTRKNDEPVIESRTTFDVEYFDNIDGNWYVDQHGFETFKLAQDYLKVCKSHSHCSNRIVQRDITVKTSVV